MNIATIIEVARKSGFMGHCTGIRLDMIDGKRWAVTLYDRDNGRPDPHGTGATPEEAIAACVTRLTKWASDRRDRAMRDKSEADELVRMIEAVKEAPNAQA